MSLWFRMYSDVINDPKVMRLPEAMRWHWVAVLCCSAKSDGRVPPTPDLAFMLRMKENAVAVILTELHAVGLIDRDADGFFPHNWDGRQFKSDTSNERVKRYRDRKRNGECNVTDAVTVTAPEQSRAEADTETEIAPRTRAPASDAFEEFWKAKPRRAGADPKAPAEKLFLAAVKAGTKAEIIIAAARRWAVVDAAKIGTEYLPQAVKWLRDKRWNDYEPNAQSLGEGPSMTLEEAVAQYAKLGRWSRHAPCTEPGSLGCNAPVELLAKYGLDPIGRKLPPTEREVA